MAFKDRDILLFEQKLVKETETMKQQYRLEIINTEKQSKLDIMRQEHKNQMDRLNVILEIAKLTGQKASSFTNAITRV